MDTQRERRRNLIVLVCLGAAGVALVAVTVFGVPIRTLLIYGMIAACPLMHLLMGHGSHGHDASGTPQLAEVPDAPSPEEPGGSRV